MQKKVNDLLFLQKNSRERESKKVVAGCVRQVDVLYSNNCMELAWADSALVALYRLLYKQVWLYIVYEISKNINISDYSTLENCLFGAVSLTKNADIDRYKYSGYGIGFHRHWTFSFPGIGRN